MDGMSGGFLPVIVGKQIRAQHPQIHQTRGRNAISSPLRYCPLRDFTQARNLNGAAKFVDDLVRFMVHVASIDIYTSKMQHLKQKNV